MNASPIIVTAHCLTRFREHWPDAERETVLDAWAAGEPLDTQLVATMTGRKPPWSRSFYRLVQGIDPDESGSTLAGILVAADEPQRRPIVTYLRLNPSQCAFVNKWYPRRVQ